MALVAINGAAARSRLDADSERLLNDMAEGFRSRCASRRYKDRYAHGVIATVLDFVRFCGRPPWAWTEADFDEWSTELYRARGLTAATQRKYQKAIAAFLDYLVENQHYQSKVHRAYNTRIRQIVTKYNSVVHKDERELDSERPAFLPDQLRALFGAIRDEMDREIVAPTKALRSVCRDYAVFLLIYVCGLRADEALRTDVGSIHPNFLHPEFGDYGSVIVLGKAAKGGGKRQRKVDFDHPDLPPVMAWYVGHIRPLFLASADPNERALFLSERGRRLSYSALWDRFQHYLAAAGLAGEHLVIHSLRHTAVTEGLIQNDPETVRRKVGHSNLATTAIYGHVPDRVTQADIDAVVARRSKQLKEETP